MKYLFLSCIILSLFSCEDPYKDPDKLELPPITMEGKNTFGCKVNGEIWLAYQDQQGLLSPTLECILDLDTFFTVQAKRRIKARNFDESIAFNYTSKWNTIQNNSLRFSNLKLEVSCGTYLNLSKDFAEIKVLKLDLEKRIFSGTFTYNSLENKCDSTDIISITDGRFDLKF